MQEHMLTEEEHSFIQNWEKSPQDRNWNDKEFTTIKTKIKALKETQTSSRCCYCQRDFTGEFSFDVDLEHILPKKKFPNYMFSLFNLSISCKRCNMNIKKERIDFLVSPFVPDTDAKSSEAYKFIHPCFDVIDDHLQKLLVQCGARRYTKYLVQNDSPKGRYTYEYFYLEQVERDNINDAIGASVPVQLSDKIKQDVQDKVQSLFAMASAD